MDLYWAVFSSNTIPQIGSLTMPVLFTFYNPFGEPSLFFVRVGAMHAAEGCFFAVNDLAVSAFIYFATAVGTNVKAGFNGDGDQVGEAFEQTCAESSSCFGKFKDLLFFLANWLNCVLHQALFFELL